MDKYFKYRTLEDYLISNPLDIDTTLNDGWGASFSVKGRLINATILFIDIVNFSGRTKNLSPVETLIFVNNFFTWITAEALLTENCIVDKYIGDEIMVIFSEEFGSSDPFIDALRSAIKIGDSDQLSYYPNMGIASGKVIIGYVGTPKKFNCSVFGDTVTLASRCVSVKSQIAFPSSNWKDYSLEDIYPKSKYVSPDGSSIDKIYDWKLIGPWIESLKNIGEVNVYGLNNEVSIYSSITAEERAKQNLIYLKNKGLCKDDL